jgi:hypothetical protein
MRRLPAYPKHLLSWIGTAADNGTVTEVVVFTLETVYKLHGESMADGGFFDAQCRPCPGLRFPIGGAHSGRGAEQIRKALHFLLGQPSLRLIC